MGRINDLANLRAAGMQVHQVLGSAGIITGAVTDAQRPAITQVPGVASVETQQEFQLPPPDSDIQ
ncbi:MAG: ketohydroxyglutarate aldolase [Actinomycetota bacterium]|nr:ketohydroxyglutarate aldolase [Actinomycetota bacterium]